MKTFSTSSHRSGLCLLALIAAATFGGGHSAHAGRAYGASVSRGYSSGGVSAVRRSTVATGPNGNTMARRTTAVTGPNGNTAVRRTTATTGSAGNTAVRTTAVAMGGSVIVAGSSTVAATRPVVAPLPAGYYATIPGGYTTVVYGGYTCRYVGGVYYRPVFYGGNTVYVVVH